MTPPDARGTSDSGRLARRRRPPVRRFVAAALAQDWSATNEVALEHMAITNSFLAVSVDLFHAAQLHIENAWHVGDASAQDEFRVYRAIESAMVALPETRPATAQALNGRILLASLFPEEHDLGVRLVAAALREAGWNVDLATKMDRDDVVARATGATYSFIGLSATFVAGSARLELAGLVADLKTLGIPVIAGGSAFIRSPLLAQRVGVDIVAADARVAVMFAHRAARRAHRAHARAAS